MKQILFIIALLAVAFTSHAQSSSVPAIDTVDNAGTVNLVSPAKYFAGDDGTWTAGVLINRISGTAAGYAILQATVDGANYAPITGTSADSVALSNTATQFKNWYMTGKMPKLVRIQIVGSGTQSIETKGYFIKN